MDADKTDKNPRNPRKSAANKKMNHVKEKLSAYLHHELPKEERQMIAEHLLLCEFCRKEHDEIRFGVELADKLESFDAPKMVWNRIENALDKQTSTAKTSLFSRQFLIPATASVLMLFTISLALYFIYFREAPNDFVENKPQKSESTEWSVKILSGKSITENDKLEVGETLATDANSRASVQVANIGQVEIEPNSRLQLVKTEATEHRLSLEEGKMSALILAPPRLFVVDTPSAVAVDLGCAYTLEVDKEGNSKLHVTSGYVALERDGRESIVPFGAMAITKKGKGLGTPFYEDVSAEFQKALYKFDFEHGSSKSLQMILTMAREKDSLTLWHLLPKTNGVERERVFKTLNKFVKLPEGVNKEGILNLDQKMLEEWRKEIGIVWF